MRRPSAAIVGAGPSGSFLAWLLAHDGYRVTVYDRRPDPRGNENRGRRSINLVVSRQSGELLERAGLGSALAGAVPLWGRIVHARDGRLGRQPYSEPGDAGSILTPRSGVRSVSRKTLADSLVAAIRRHDAIELRFDTEIRDVDPLAGELRLAGGRTESAGLIVGADGAFSIVRRSLERTAGCRVEHADFDFCYRELSVPPRDGEEFAMDGDALHLWPRQGSMLIALPNHDRSFRATLFLPDRGPRSFESLSDEASVRRLFCREFRDLPAPTPELARELLSAPTGRLMTLLCRPWHAGRTVLVGDACHTLLPFTGKGVNLALEDCRVLRDCLRTHATDRLAAFDDYAARRAPTTAAVAEKARALAPLLLSLLPEDGVRGRLGGNGAATSQAVEATPTESHRPRKRGSPRRTSKAGRTPTQIRSQSRDR